MSPYDRERFDPRPRYGDYDGAPGLVFSKSTTDVVIPEKMHTLAGMVTCLHEAEVSMDTAILLGLREVLQTPALLTIQQL